MRTERRTVFVGDDDPRPRFRVKHGDFWIDTRIGASLKIAFFDEGVFQQWEPAGLSMVIDNDNYSRVSVDPDGSIAAYVVANGGVRTIVTLGRDEITLTGPSGRQLILGEHLVFAGDWPTADPHKASVAYLENGFVRVSAG